MKISKSCDVCPNIYHSYGKYKCTFGLSLDNVDLDNERHKLCPLEGEKQKRVK